MKVLKFRNCEVYVWPDAKYLETRFKDGTVCKAAPSYDEESKARAIALGYGVDLWAMTLDHELTHTVLAEMEGKEVSPALWAVAHPMHPRSFSDLHNEECRVLEFQRFFRLHTAALKNLSD